MVRSAASRVPGRAGGIRRYILLLAAAGGAPIAGRDRLHLVMFLLSNLKDLKGMGAGYVRGGGIRAAQQRRGRGA